MALTLYAHLWIGHNIQDIANSFSSPPSAQYSQNSIMRAIAVWSGAHRLPAHPLPYDPLYIFSFRSIWNYVNLAALAVFLIIGCIWLWKAPNIRTFILAALATLGALLLITPWFFSWYVTWLVALAAVCLPATYTRIGRALLAFTLVFSASA